MNDYGPATYGDRIAEIYDRFHPGAGDATAQLRALAALAGRSGALELGIGTGRVALPLDLMARLAGLRLRERWSDWTGAPFTAASTSHISLYEHEPAPR